MIYRDMTLVHYHLVDYLGKTVSGVLYIQAAHIQGVYIDMCKEP